MSGSCIRNGRVHRLNFPGSNLWQARHAGQEPGITPVGLLGLARKPEDKGPPEARGYAVGDLRLAPLTAHAVCAASIINLAVGWSMRRGLFWRAP